MTYDGGTRDIDCIRSMRSRKCTIPARDNVLFVLSALCPWLFYCFDLQPLGKREVLERSFLKILTMGDYSPRYWTC